MDSQEYIYGVQNVPEPNIYIQRVRQRYLRVTSKFLTVVS